MFRSLWRLKSVRGHASQCRAVDPEGLQSNQLWLSTSSFVKHAHSLTLVDSNRSSFSIGDFCLLARPWYLCRYSSLLTALWIFVFVVVACVRSTVAHVAGFVCAITATSNVEASAERLHLDAQHKGQGDDGQEECELHCVC